MVLNIHSDQLENHNILSSSVYQAWWCHLGLLPCEDQWGGGEHTVCANPWRLFGENFSNEAHNLQWHLAFQPVSLSLTAKPPSFIVPTLRNSIKKLLKTLLRTVCQFQEGAGFRVVVFFFCLATWFRAMESFRHWVFELIALEQRQTGGADMRVEYCMLSAVHGAFWPTISVSQLCREGLMVFPQRN